QQSFALTSEQLTEYREVENKRAAQYHCWGLAMTILALLLIVLSVVLILGGQVSLTTATLVSSALSQSISVLLFRREDAAHKRVRNYFVQLNELNYLGNLLTICDTLQSPANRETYKMKVIDKVTERWFERNVA
ncbi:MAG: hypothetical protein R3264_05145, partial [Anaerolineae bacterium]|nr:hypothetical protein [Anaerolineae bacterium]